MENLIFENTVVSIREITPTNAANLLDAKNTKNRNISKGKVSEYINAMKNGEWMFNGDSIRISNEGILLDGQHRLTAVAKSGLSQHFIIIENMQKEIGLTIDVGKVRNGGDVLSLEAGVGRNMAQSISGAIKIFHKHNTGKSMSNSGTGRLTNVQVVEKYKENERLITFCVEWMNENVKRQGAILAKSEMLACLMIFASIDKDACISFSEMVFCGLGITEACTQSFLRDYLQSCKVDSKKSTSTQRLHTIIKSWNSIRSGRVIKVARNIVFYPGRDTFKKAI